MLLVLTMNIRFLMDVLEVHLLLRVTVKVQSLVSFQDGQDLPPPIGFDVETPTTIPPCKVTNLFQFLRNHVSRHALL